MPQHDSPSQQGFDLLTFFQRKDVQHWIMLGLVVGGLYLLLRTKGTPKGLGPACSLLGSALLSGWVTPHPELESQGHTHLIQGLYNLEEERGRVTPTELWNALRGWGVVFATPQKMGQVVGAIGLHSEIGTVPGRTERRWYNLTAWRQGHEISKISS